MVGELGARKASERMGKGPFPGMVAGALAGLRPCSRYQAEATGVLPGSCWCRQVGHWDLKGPGFGGGVGRGQASGLPPTPAVLRGLLSETSCPLNLPGFQRAYVSRTPMFTMLNVDLDVEKQ